jgi:hypothetical protein
MDKGVQSRLPDWGLDGVKKIKRYGAMVLQKVDEEKGGLVGEKATRFCGRVYRSYRVILAGCGESTRVWVESDRWKIELVIPVAYWVARRLIKGTYIEGVGYCGIIDSGELLKLSAKYSGFLSLWERIFEKEEDYDSFWGRGGEKNVG